jgi:hypothetical protein
MSLEQSPHPEERRDSIRAKRIVTVRHRLSKHNGRYVNGKWQMSVTEDMSLSGLLFVSAIAYEKDDLVELEVVMSGLLNIFKGYGQVIRLTRQKGGFYYVAVKYVDFKKPLMKAKTRSAKSMLKKP